MYIKRYNNFILESNETEDSDELYHGTSEKQLNLIKKNKYEVEDFYVSDNYYNIMYEYSIGTAKVDRSRPIVIILSKSECKDLLKTDENHPDWAFVIRNANIKNLIKEIVYLD